MAVKSGHLIAGVIKSLVCPARGQLREAIGTRPFGFSRRAFSFSSRITGLDSTRNRNFSRSLRTMNPVYSSSHKENQSKSENPTVVVEGNIGSGKAQVLNYFSGFPCVEVCEEPIELWRNRDGVNLLDLMYKDPKANSFGFQQYVLETMLNIHDKPHKLPVRMIERSIFSGRYIFTENLLRNGFLTKDEYAKLDAQYQSHLVGSRNIKIDLIIYIRTDPEIAHERIMRRGRHEEKAISVEFLNQIHDRHEEWLCQGKFPIPAPILMVDGNVSLVEVREQLRRNYQKILFGWADSPTSRASLPSSRTAIGDDLLTVVA